MSTYNGTNGHHGAAVSGHGGNGCSISVSVVLQGEQAAAVEGWRVANRIDSQPEAVRELVRIGLLSEIGRIYRMIAEGRELLETAPDDEDEES